jgi:peptidyl-tRNA hydrolase
MSPGKLAAQAGHAFTEALHVAGTDYDLDSDVHENYLKYQTEHPGTKVVLCAPDEAALHRIYATAWKFVPCTLVYDSGHVLPPHFDGKPILTALGLGPTTKAKAAPFIGKLALVP